MAHIITLGNEKGGSGKSTTAMHVITALLAAGKSVAALDLDLRQQSLFRYLENREAFVARTGQPLPLPERVSLTASALDSQAGAAAEEETSFADTIAALSHDFVVIDTPGAFTTYSRLAHAAADTLITPLNDSLIDFDMLARIDPATGKVLGPTTYSEMVWKARQIRAASGRPPLDWLVLRNRLTTIDARNKRRVAAALANLAKRIGFRLVPGFSERVVFREMFLDGKTLIDLLADPDTSLTMSHIAARTELRAMIRDLSLPGVDIAF